MTTKPQPTIEDRISQGRGEEPADLVLKGGKVWCMVTGALIAGDVAICGDTIVGIGAEYQGRREIDVAGATLVPGFSGRCTSASMCGVRTMSVRRGSMTISFAPCRRRFFRREPNTG